MKSDTWYDVSAHGLQLVAIKVPSGRHYLGMMGQPGTTAFAAAQDGLGFKVSPAKASLLVREVDVGRDGRLVWPFGPAEVMSTLAGAKVVGFDPDVHYRDQSKAVRQPASQATQELSGGRPIGTNALGHTVFETEDGRRYAVDERRRTLPEADAGPGQRGNFLRATAPDGTLDPEALLRCAQGLVEHASRGNEVNDLGFSSFLSTVAGPRGRAHAAAARRAVETALSGHLARKGGKTLREAFIAGHKLSGNLPFLASPDRVGMDLQVAVAVQRLLGVSSDAEGLPIHVDGAGSGELLTHLPKEAPVRVTGADPATRAAAASVASAAGLKGFSGDDDGTPAGRLVLDARGEADLDRIDAALDARDPGGSAVVVLDEPTTDEDLATLARYRDHLAVHHEFEAEARIAPALSGGRGRIVLSLGARRPAPAPDALPPLHWNIEEWSALWTWTAQVVSERAKADAPSLPEDDAQGPSGGRTDTVGNAFQTPYVSASRIGEPKTMVPRNLEGATQEALARAVKAAGGDVDAWVAREFGYEVDDLARLFSAEQVDALALYLLAEERDRGFLTADQTGVGKGRFIAAVLRRNAIKGIPSLFLTERPMNLSDIWRDIVHTESAHLFSPMILNDGTKVIDEATRETVLRSAPREQVDAMLDAKAWPEGVNLVMATYSQFQGEAPDPARLAKGGAEESLASRKAAWLAKAVDKRHRIVADECHNAASMESNTSHNIVEAIRRADPSVVYSSATFAKNADHMAFYAPLFPGGVSFEELEGMMKTGGESFQEVLSWMLASDGVMIRREFDLSRVTYETILDTPRFERNRAYMDAVAPVLQELVQLSGDVDRLIQTQNARDEQARIAQEERRRKIKPFHLTRTGMGSPLYTITRLFVTALKVDAVVEDALASLEANKKPVIFVENTVQTLLDELSESEANVEGTVVADFRALFHRTLRTMTEARWKNHEDVQFRRDMADSDPALRAKVDRIKEMIEGLPHLPVSSIDEIKRRIREAGWSVDEITGRTVEVRDGRIVRRPASNPTVVKNAFNSGDLDAIVINAAGSTGIDLHAGSRFEDQRKRRLIEAQSPADVLKRVQGHGRINRYDQVEDPEIVSFASGLPVEMRLRAMENAHVRRLSANTTSNRDAAILSRDIPDLINHIGDKVCAQYAQSRPDLMRRLGFQVDDIVTASGQNLAREAEGMQVLEKTVVATRRGGAKGKDGKETDASIVEREASERKVRSGGFRVSDQHRTANEILARLIMLTVAQQEQICNELIAEFKATTEEMEARGEAVLRTQELPGVVYVRTRTVFDGAEAEAAGSVFNEPLYVIDGSVKRTGKPIRSAELMERIQIGSMASGRAQPCVDLLRTGIDEILRPFLPTGCLSVAEALQREEGRERKDVTQRKARIERLADVLQQVRPGKEVTYTIDGETTACVVTRVEYAERGYEHIPGSYGVEFVAPGDEKPRSMRLETLMRDPGFSVSEGLEGNKYDEVLERFDKADKARLTTVSILVHNVYKAMRMNVEHKLGKLQTFVLSDGTRHRGVVLSGPHRTLRTVPVEMRDAAMAWEALSHRGADLVGNATLADKGFSMRPALGDTAVEVRLPKKKSKMGFIYDHEVVAALYRRWAPDGRAASMGPRLVVEKAEARELIKALYESGARFWCAPTERDWAQDYARRNMLDVEPDAPEQDRAPMGMVA